MFDFYEVETKNGKKLEFRKLHELESGAGKGFIGFLTNFLVTTKHPIYSYSRCRTSSSGVGGKNCSRPGYV